MGESAWPALLLFLFIADNQNLSFCCSKPVRKEVFLDHFWDCFETFKQHSAEGAGMPAYFRFLTLLGRLSRLSSIPLETDSMF